MCIYLTYYLKIEHSCKFYVFLTTIKNKLFLNFWHKYNTDTVLFQKCIVNSQ